MWWIVATGVLLGASDFTVSTADGQQLRGALVELTAQHAVIDTAEGQRRLPTAQIVDIAPTPAAKISLPATAVWVRLIDGSIVVAEAVEVAADKVQMTHLGQRLSVATPLVADIRLREQNVQQAQQWAEIREVKPAGDLIVLRKEGVLDYLEGVVGEITADTVMFNLDGENIPVKRERVEGVVYFRPAVGKPPSPFATVTDASGSRWPMVSARFDDNQLRFVTPAGAEAAVSLAAVAGFEFQAVYLSDMKAESVRWTPFLSAGAGPSEAMAAFYRPRMNRSLSGGPLLLGGRSYTKGIALHSKTELTYRFTEPYRTFTCVAGIDDRVRPAGHVQLTIFGDDRVLFDEPVSGTDAPRGISLDLSGITRLKFVVDFGDDLDISDHLDLCDARLFP